MSEPPAVEEGLDTGSSDGNGAPSDASATPSDNGVAAAGEEQPELVEHLIGLREAEDWTGLLERALAGIGEVASELDAGDVAECIVEGVERSQGDRTRAVRALTDLGSRFPATATLHFLIADFLVGANEAGQALDSLERLIARVDDGAVRGTAWEQMGDIASTLKRPQDAILHYRAAFRADKARTGALRKAVELFLAQGRPINAKELLDDLKNASSDSERAGLAPLYLRVAEGLVMRPPAHDVAKKALTAVLDIEPDNAEAKALLEQVEGFGDHWKEHIKSLRDAALDARDKRDAASKYLDIAQIYRTYAPDEPEQMQQNIDKCLLLAPGHPPALRFLEEVYRAGGHREVEEHEDQRKAGEREQQLSGGQRPRREHDPRDQADDAEQHTGAHRIALRPRPSAD